MDNEKKPIGFLRRGLKVDEVSLVDLGANPGAKMELYKRKNDDTILLNPANEDPQAMNLEELKKALEAKELEIAKLKSEKDQLVQKSTAADEALVKTKAELETAKADIAKANEEIQKAKMPKKEAPKDCELDEEMKKSLPPSVLQTLESLKKKADEQQKQLAESVAVTKALQDQLELQSLEKSAEEAWPNLPGTSVEKAVLLKTVNSMPEKAKAYFDSVLKAGNEAMAQKMVAIGKSGVPQPSDADAQLDNMIKSYAETHKVDNATATDAVLKSKEGGLLYAKANAAV